MSIEVDIEQFYLKVVARILFENNQWDLSIIRTEDFLPLFRLDWYNSHHSPFWLTIKLSSQSNSELI